MRTRRLAISVALVAFIILPACGHRAVKSATSALDDSVPTPVSASTARGAALYVKNCEACHGARGVAGPVGPSLAGERLRHTHDEILSAIKNPDPPMPKLFPGELSAQDVADLSAYVERL